MAANFAFSFIGLSLLASVSPVLADTNTTFELAYEVWRDRACGGTFATGPGPELDALAHEAAGLLVDPEARPENLERLPHLVLRELRNSEDLSFDQCQVLIAHPHTGALTLQGLLEDLNTHDSRIVMRLTKRAQLVRAIYERLIGLDIATQPGVTRAAWLEIARFVEGYQSRLTVTPEIYRHAFDRVFAGPETLSYPVLAQALIALGQSKLDSVAKIHFFRRAQILLEARDFENFVILSDPQSPITLERDNAWDGWAWGLASSGMALAVKSALTLEAWGHLTETGLRYSFESHARASEPLSREGREILATGWTLYDSENTFAQMPSVLLKLTNAHWVGEPDLEELLQKAINNANSGIGSYLSHLRDLARLMAVSQSELEGVIAHFRIQYVTNGPESVIAAIFRDIKNYAELLKRFPSIRQRAQPLIHDAELLLAQARLAPRNGERDDVLVQILLGE